MSSGLFDKTLNGLQASLNLRQTRHSIINSNIANAETPGFHAKKIDFEESLARAMDTDGMNSLDANRKEHFLISREGTSRINPEIYENPDANVSNDQNTVNLEKEMAALAENSILYKATLQLINKKMGALKYVANEGR